MLLWQTLMATNGSPHGPASRQRGRLAHQAVAMVSTGAQLSMLYAKQLSIVDITSVHAHLAHCFA